MNYGQSGLKFHFHRHLMKLFFLFIPLIPIILLSNCTTPKDNPGKAPPSFSKDLEEIKTNGKLKALTTYSGTSYFLYRGQPMGFEYDLAKAFADFLGVELKINVAESWNDI